MVRAICLVMFAALLAGGSAMSASAQDRSTITIPAVSYTAVEGGKVKIQVPAGDKKKAGARDCVQFWSTPGHWLEWTIEDAAAGDYELVLSYSGMHDVRRSVAVNGKPVKGLEDFTIPETGKQNWESRADHKAPAALPLAAGRNVLRMTCLDESSLRLGKLTLKGPGGKEIVIKATAFTAQGGGHVNTVVPQTLGYVMWEGVNPSKPDKEGPVQAGMALVWTVESAQAGLHRVVMHYTSDGLSRLELSVNGEPVKGLEEFIPPRTGDDDVWVLGTLPIPITLKQGANTLKLKMLEGTKKKRGDHPVPDIVGYLSFGLSAIQLVPTAEGDAPARDMLETTTMGKIEAEVRKMKRPDLPPAPTGPALPKVEGALAPAAGQSFKMGGRTATFTKVDLLPFVDSKYSQLYKFENYDHPDLKRFAEKYKLAEVVAPGKDEFEKQMILMNWVWNQWRFGQGRELYYLDDPFWIMAEARKEHKFQCMHSADVLHTAANSLGWVSRLMKAPSHSYNEVWSNQYRKWVQFDATGNWVPTKDGVPQSTYETRVSWMREKEKSPVQRSHWEDGGIKTVPSELFMGLRSIGFITRGNVLGDARYEIDYPRESFSISDDLSPGRYLSGIVTENPPTDPYFPINQAAMALVPSDEGLKVTLGTLTPNFKEFRVRRDGGNWQPSEQAFAWRLHDGENRLEAVSVNKFGVEGPISTLVVTVDK
jgi:hypothetical protein